MHGTVSMQYKSCTSYIIYVRLYQSHNKEQLFPQTAFDDSHLWWRHTVFSVKYEITIHISLKRVKTCFTFRPADFLPLLTATFYKNPICKITEARSTHVCRLREVLVHMASATKALLSVQSQIKVHRSPKRSDQQATTKMGSYMVRCLQKEIPTQNHYPCHKFLDAPEY